VGVTCEEEKNRRGYGSRVVRLTRRRFVGVSPTILVSALPRRGAPGAGTLQALDGGTPGLTLQGHTVTSFAFGADFEDVSGEALVSAPQGAQNLGMSQAVCLFRTVTSSAFGADFEDVSGEALVSASQGAQIVGMS